MKRLLLPCLLLIAGLSAYGFKAYADEDAAEPVEFREAFERYQHEGTLFTYEACKEFQANSWGVLYRNAVKKRFSGTPIQYLRLNIGTQKGYNVQTGKMLDLRFRLCNDSNKDVIVTVGGSCHVVHQVSFMVIDPQGQLNPSLGMRLGAHCYCQQKQQTLAAHSSVTLDTDTTDSGSFSSFTPWETGEYLVIGKYGMPTKKNPQRCILSRPLVLNVAEK